MLPLLCRVWVWITQGSVSWTTHSMLRVTPPVIPAKAGIQ